MTVMSAEEGFPQVRLEFGRHVCICQMFEYSELVLVLLFMAYVRLGGKREKDKCEQ